MVQIGLIVFHPRSFAIILNGVTYMAVLVSDYQTYSVNLRWSRLFGLTSEQCHFSANDKNPLAKNNEI